MSHIGDVIAGIHGAVDALANDRDVYRNRWFHSQARYECLRGLITLHLMDIMTDEQNVVFGSVITGTHPSIEATIREMREEYP